MRGLDVYFVFTMYIIMFLISRSVNIYTNETGLFFAMQVVWLGTCHTGHGLASSVDSAFL